MQTPNIDRIASQGLIGTPQTRTGPDGLPFPAVDTTRPWDSLADEERRLMLDESMRYSFNHGDAPGRRKTQFYSVRELVSLWFAEAGANRAFPLDDRSAVEILNTPRPQLTAHRDHYTYFPGVAGVPEAQSVNIRNRNYIVGALVDIPAAGASGVVFAQGSHFGGHALYIKDDRLHYVYNFDGTLEQLIVATEDVPTGENLILSASFIKDGEDPPGVSTGLLALFYGDEKVAEQRIKTQPSAFGLSGTDLTVGRSITQITNDYPGERPWTFSGGTIRTVAVDVSGEPYVDLERAATAMIARE